MAIGAVEGVPPPAVPETRRRKWARRISRGFAIFAVTFILLVGWLALTAPLSKSLEPIAPPEVTLLAADGTPIARAGAIVDKPVKVSALPKHVTGAFLAIEDRRFYSHWGVDPRSVGRAVWSNVTGGRTQGGSTITQQLAKFTFLTPKRTLGRKAREALIAFWLEAWLTKDEILERYLSNAYFGDNTYGLRAASLHYFYRQPEKLTPAQAAMLAGLVQAPSRLAPTKNPDLAAKRMKLVVDAMVDTGTITAAEAKAMRTPRIDVRARNDLPTGTYFADWALPEARRLSDVGYSRQTIRTTLDARLQGIARRVTSRAAPGKAQVALVAMRPNGEVVAMVGGRDYAASPFNRVTQARRQPGSTFKLFVYLAALKDGKRPDDLIDNRAITTGSYQPKNAGGAYSDTITLEDAFATSSNVAAVRLLREVGDDKVIRVARDLGVTSPLARGDPSLALGTSSMTLLELTAAYAAVAANSYPVVPHAFKEEEAGWFERWFTGPRHFPSGVHDDIEQMLRAAVNRGTGRAARLPQANFGKTGTSQDSRDALFVGYANGLVVGVWIGNDDNSPLQGIYGGGLPARIWRDFMVQANGQAVPRKAPPARAEDPGTPVQPLDIPEIPAIPIDDKTSVGVKDGNAVISTEIGGTKVDLKLPIGDRPPAPPPAPAQTPP
ncbi:penicillin-binding protein [Sphingopyxis sp. H071]|nr:penicillin-binding protein [Sphingopyxis sp. H057]KTE49732.1 penicillin-binding protein [Sphingopyxis sp. H073]KTE54244.1 penicillin-binding protein [Sphingopyxis sp. H071]KTE57257.1 penicillin-binding protein [Sphingopyxis sp. H107]KTE60733.1 penicillin-binding protein [Sphingopyxis sp. H100]KTE68415.1 penicillin-binding protein [Sphingopyxis sp. H081]KTE77270.1 penicillin-binding protein [Sphingopyxis sp. H067]